MRIGIKHKLFAAILAASLAVSIGTYVFMKWSFDRGMLRYVNDRESAFLVTVNQRLVHIWAEDGGWERLARDRELWRETHTGLSGVDDERPSGKPDRRPPPGESPERDRGGERRSPQDDSQGFGQRLVLLDASKRKVVGGPPVDVNNLKLAPISFSGETIGYLGLVEASKITDAGELLFAEQQAQNFALAASLMALLSMAITFPLAVNILRPIRHLTEGARKLIAGQFSARIEVTTKDELGKLSEDFNTLAITLEKNESDRKKWVADISHELRTPLSVLRGDIEALQDGVRKPTPVSISALHAETMRLGRLINDLHELSRSDIGALDYRKSEVNPIAILLDALENFEPRLNAAGIKLENGCLEPGKHKVLADPDRLHQLFSNLIENTMRYTDAPGMLVVSAETKGDRLLIDFMDSPPGVPEDSLGKLFDRLYRVEASRNRATGGSGLGMAIAKNIVEAHRGSITARRSHLGGLWIRIEMPVEV